ncbi:MAG TPA: helix-turn-helix domain-containing protein [Chitinophagales bacterium]
MDVIKCVTKCTGFSHDDLKGISRKRVVIEPRYITMYLLRKYSRLSLTKIGSLLNRDHSSVVSGIWNAKVFSEVDEQFRAKLTVCECSLPKTNTPVCNSRVNHWVAMGLEWNNLRTIKNKK